MRRRVRLLLAGLAWTLVLVYGLSVLGVTFVSHTRGALPEKGRVDPLFSHVATVVSRTDTEVRCWSNAAWKQNNVEWHRRWPKLGPLGYWRGYTYPTYPPVVNLPPNVCNALLRLVHEGSRAQKDPWRKSLSWSAGMLAHESQHARGILNEAMAECYGMQRIRQTAVALGRSSAEGRYLSRLYWKHWYPEDNSVYGSRDCRNGGRLDLRPKTEIWP